jgi:hypothetical protein
MLAVAGDMFTSTLSTLRLAIDPAVITGFVDASYLPNLSQLGTLDLVMSTVSLRWPQAEPLFSLGGSLPVLESLYYNGCPNSGFFQFLASLHLPSIAKVEMICRGLRTEDRQGLLTFLSTHVMQSFIFRSNQTLAETMNILRDVCATHLGLDIASLWASYGLILPAIPEGTCGIIVCYTDYKANFHTFMQAILSHTHSFRAVLVRGDATVPFHWVPSPFDRLFQDQRGSIGSHMVDLTHWARLLAARGIRMLDERGLMLRESGPAL